MKNPWLTTSSRLRKIGTSVRAERRGQHLSEDEHRRLNDLTMSSAWRRRQQERAAGEGRRSPGNTGRILSHSLRRRFWEDMRGGGMTVA